MENVDTIAAIASARGNAGVGIIRISGPACREIQLKLYANKLVARKATLVDIFDQQQHLIDQVIFISFPAPNSFTGEDVLELQGHGGVVVLDMLLEHVLSLGCRQARPGEFSERAFLNNKIDLTQAEAIADLIECQTRSAARGAIRSLQGEFSKKIHQLVEKLVHLRVYAEAYLDFPDEEIDDLPVTEFEQQLSVLVNELEQLLLSANKGNLLRNGFHLVLAGRPNAGKSSLLNTLTENETAIVSDQAGTTRDIIRDRIVLDGIAIDVTDTAGLRQTSDSIESEGVRRAQNELEKADRVLLIIDEAEYEQEANKLIEAFVPDDMPVTILRNKIDLLNKEPELLSKGNTCEILLSIKTGAGIDLLYEHLKDVIAGDSEAEGVFTARRRHIEALTKALLLIKNAKKHLHPVMQLELLAEDCRLGQVALNEITGEFTSEDMLGKIFSSFCIGK
ncbi:MAG: tRNA uridine-5-carboxymethylaminomethyl(34) synthesis GTPase MnmE [Gammaproteobacteria bacterium]|nr:tRNA uridine-5-carboxymethylaminomethyl(34) synthesis GTPase MnmE [Gammaproteobacteria bacterium]